MKSLCLAILATGLVLSGCSKREEPAAPPPPPAPSPVRESRSLMPDEGSVPANPLPSPKTARSLTPLPPDILAKYQKAQNDTDERARLIDEVAMHSLDNEDSKESITLLAGMLRIERAPELKVSILDELGMIESGKALEPIVSALDPSQPEEVREAAGAAAESVLSSLGFQGTKSAVDYIIPLLDSRYPSTVRETAINTLEDLEDKRAIPALQRLINDTDEKVRTAAQAAIETLQEQ